jgi:fructokinase
MFGKQMQRHFSDNRVQLIEELCNVPEHSMLAFARLDEKGSASYSFYTEGTTIAALTTEEIIDILQDHDEIHYLHVGSVSTALESSGPRIAEALGELDPRPFIFFDPNVRPTVVEDERKYRRRVLEIAKMATMIKLSDEDLRLLLPGLPSDEGVAQLLALGVEHVVLTKGKDGLLWRSSTDIDVSVPAIDNPIVDTVGAGDTVSGALLAALHEHQIGPGDPVDEDLASSMLRFAAAAASVTTSRKGADPPKLSEIPDR